MIAKDDPASNTTTTCLLLLIVTATASSTVPQISKKLSFCLLAIIFVIFIVAVRTNTKIANTTDKCDSCLLPSAIVTSRLRVASVLTKVQIGTQTRVQFLSSHDFLLVQLDLALDTSLGRTEANIAKQMLFEAYYYFRTTGCLVDPTAIRTEVLTLQLLIRLLFLLLPIQLFYLHLSLFFLHHNIVLNPLLMEGFKEEVYFDKQLPKNIGFKTML